MGQGRGLAQSVLRGDVRAGARVISLIEADAPEAAEAQSVLFPHTGRAEVIGITGPPGAGKSTLVDRVIGAYRAGGHRVAVVAVDPSSPFTGGAVLGDRIRMSSHAQDENVFVRSMAARRHLGGLAVATPAAVRVLDALGFDRIVVETVGVGQSEVAVADSVDCTVLVSMPGAGDAVQTMKAGVIEIGDVFVVNKADRDGAKRTAQEIRAMLRLGDRVPTPPVLLTRADRGEGIEKLVEAIEEHGRQTVETGDRDKARLRHLKRETLALIAAEARSRAVNQLDRELVTELVDALRERTLDPAAVAARVLANSREPEPIDA